jgi:hypothetical protein
MSEPKKYFRTLVKVFVLSEDEPWSGTIDTLAEDINEGHFVGHVLEQTIKELTFKQMREALEDAGNDGTFFDGLNDLNPLHVDDEVQWEGNYYTVEKSPDGEDKNPDASPDDVFVITDGEGTSFEVFRHELS